jgi:glycosyltransferase involved in cell wall biosynthesis
MNAVSVVIPTFNRDGVIRNAVESVLDQVGVDCEVIVVDDGSTDNTSEVLAPLKNRIRYVRTENGGASAARNRGIRESSSDWIAFLDSDDVWHPDKLALQRECVLRTGARVCFCPSADERGTPVDDLVFMDSQLAEGAMRYYPPHDCRMFKQQYRHPFVQSMLVDRKALMQAGGFDQTLYVAEDTQLIARLVLANGYSVLNRSLVTIRRHRDVPGLSDSMDAVSAFRRHECNVRVQSELLWRLVPLDMDAALRARRNMLYFASRTAEIACALGDASTARRYALSALDLRTDWRSMLRNLLILFALPLVHQRFAAKWPRLAPTGTHTGARVP